MPPLDLKPQAGWIFPFLSYGICRMKRKRIKGLKTPEQTCLALISLLSGTERQKECSKPELLLALRRQTQVSALWGAVCPACHNPVTVTVTYLVPSTPPSCRNLEWVVVRLRSGHGFHSSQEWKLQSAPIALGLCPSTATDPPQSSRALTTPTQHRGCSMAVHPANPNCPDSTFLITSEAHRIHPWSKKSIESEVHLLDPYPTTAIAWGTWFDTPQGMKQLKKTILLEVHHPEQLFSNPITLLHYCRFFSAGPEGD